MELRLLGSLEVRYAGRPLALGGVQQRAVLAMLALRPNEVVSTDVLIDGLWGNQAPPASALNIVQSYVSRLRKILQAESPRDGSDVAVIRRRRPGYLLEFNPEGVDLHRFHRLVREGTQALGPAPARAADMLREAVGLWRGQPLAEFADTPFAQAEIPRLQQQRLAALQARLEADLTLGHHAELIEELQALVAEHPLHEGLHRLLMLSLYRCGRQGEALEGYRRARHILAEELGIDPGRALQELQEQMLRADPALAPPATATGAASGPPAASVEPVPRQLPAPVRHFTGRTTELGALDGLLAEATAAGGPVVISAIAGTAGIGKTTLAVHWAHRITDQFPDGQLYVNLRGFDPGGSPMTPAEAVRGFLDALAVPLWRRPVDLDAQAALYRSRLAGRRMLVVLDNARDTAQVRPLLPGAPGCLVLVTSRNRLTGLIVEACAQPLTLDLFTHSEAKALLGRRLSPARILAEPRATEEIIAACAGLPLALTLVTARAVARPAWPLASLACELRDAHARLDALAGQDGPTADVRSVFSWSYQQLGDPAARLFRLLGLHPGPHVTAAAAASLAGLPLSQVRSLLAELTGAHLLAEPHPGRHAFHDLLRAYAAEQARSVDTEADRQAAMHRLLDHYLHTAHAAARLLGWIRIVAELTPQQPGVTLGDLLDAGQALAWCGDEYSVIVAAIEQAASAGFDTHAWQLVWAIEMFFDWCGHCHDWAAAGLTALAAARRLDKPGPQALAHRSLAGAYIRLGRHDEAVEHAQQAVRWFQEIGDRVGQAYSHLTFDRALDGQGRYGEALHQAQQALEQFRAVNHQNGQARALNAVGWYHTLLGDHRQALAHCLQALPLLKETHDHHGLAATKDTLGHIHSRLFQHNEAIDCYRQAVELFRELGARYYVATAFDGLGDALNAAGNPQAARDAHQQAYTMLKQLAHPKAEAVRAKLHHPEHSQPLTTNPPSGAPGAGQPQSLARSVPPRV